MGPRMLLAQRVSAAWRSWAPEVTKCIWSSQDVFATAMVVNSVFVLSNMITEPSLRSWVACGTTRGDDIVVGAGANFSGSAACGDKAYVVERAVQLGGLLHAAQGLMGLLAIPLLGAHSDQHGRLPVLYVSFAGMFAWLWMSFSFGGSTPLLLTAFGIRGLTSAFAPTFSSIIGDRGGDRSLAFTVKLVCGLLGSGIGWAAALLVLRAELTDYSRVWAACLAFFGVATCLAMRIRESLPAHAGRTKLPQVSDDDTETDAQPPVSLGLQLADSLAAYVTLVKEPFFFRYCLSKFLSAFGISVVFLLRSYVLSAYDWPQGRLEALSGVVGTCALLSTMCGPALIQRFSVEAVLLRCSLVVAAAMTLLCAAPLGPMFCMSALLLLGSAACAMAASSAFVAERFPEDQGKAQSALVVVIQLAISIGHFVYSRLYRAKAAGAEQAIPFVVAAVATWLGYWVLRAAFSLPAQEPVAHKDCEQELERTMGESSPIGKSLC